MQTFKRFDIMSIAVIITIINILVYIYEIHVAGSTNISSGAALAIGANYEPVTFGQHQYWRLFSAMFMHLSLMHIISNTIALIYAAEILNNLVSRWEFIAIYLISGITGNLASALLQKPVVAAGASTSIMGLIGAILVIALMAQQGIINVQGDVSGLISYAVQLLFINIVGAVGGTTDVLGHIGGAVGGGLVALIAQIL